MNKKDDLKDLISAVEGAKNGLQAARDELAEVTRMIDEVEKRKGEIEKELVALIDQRGKNVTLVMKKGLNLEETILEDSRQVTGKRDELEWCKDALKELKKKLQPVEQGVRQAKAVCFDAEAALLIGEADLRQPEIDKLLAKLEELEGAKYVVGYEIGVTYAGGMPHQQITPYESTTGNLRRKAEYFQACGLSVLDKKAFPTSFITGLRPFEIPEYLMS